ncbi:sushi domain-containing protein 6 isoform X2 [Chanos chanos]|uniref:Sushi domain-containing protein 6 isoform X2 n=1 Tax=Chanos chanos TaxID=29144 RepID=A0A6J2VQW5_CHACN|nr:sushi domain-containing protein 6-like isoform X2 [Chanos chanos]
MSAQRLSLWSCLHCALSFGVFILAILPERTTGKNCSHPVVPEHGGFRCEPSPCRGFPQKSYIYYFCEPGYVLPGRVHRSVCRHGRWTPSVPTCVLSPDGHPKYEDKVANSLPSVATTAVGVSIFLLTTTVCMVVKSRLYPCQSHNRRSSDQLDLVVDGLPVALPTYEEAVYGSWGQRLPPNHGPTQLLLAQEASEHSPLSSQIHSDSNNCTDGLNQSPEGALPPPYEEVQSRSRDGRLDDGARSLQIALSGDKDT